ncbi:hypothetical protein DL766_001136 [Monosporascus sp. MC13-8B]|uniref:Uncharacterized protein n=1 Tax=Monosporascus cannonballus TaxID=155416 RepID=A0ABY0GV39_9PEZI|nr:hypothetical protein DL762_008924 [Monosporascus cannonballus]RYO85706.1 hypothetical protein DL763_007009 [Monosporascus cannonballus]RYP38226.1 hypothetical protein DL766_001136 [Monosporascus sp. MC13-8B]
MHLVASLKEVTKESEEERPAADDLIDDTSDFSGNVEAVDEHSPESSQPPEKRKRTRRHRTSHRDPPRPAARGRFHAPRYGPPLAPANTLRLPDHSTRPATSWAAATYDQPAPPPPFPFSPGTSSEKSSLRGSPRPTMCSTYIALAPSADEAHTAPWAAPDPFKLPVRRPVLSPHYDWHARGQQPAPSAYSECGPEPAWLRAIHAADGGVDEPMPDHGRRGRADRAALG